MTYLRVIFLLIAILCTMLTACESDGTTPVIAASDSIEATGGIFFTYQPKRTNLDESIITISYDRYPSWLTVGGDSLYGTPPDGLGDTSFVVIATNDSSTDTTVINIDMIPCLVVYGDTRSDHDIHRQVNAAVMAVHPATVFHSGDLVGDGTVASQWDTFNLITEQLRASTEFYSALGNHEEQSQLYFDNFDLPGNEQWFSIDQNGIHFVILNSNVAMDSSSEQYQWAENDLASVDAGINFIAVIIHHPPHSSGRYSGDKKGVGTTLVPLFQKYNVDIVFSGHDHIYERLFCEDIYYIVAGGGGAPPYSLTQLQDCSQVFENAYHFCKLSTIDQRLIVTVLDPDGRQIDRFELAR